MLYLVILAIVIFFIVICLLSMDGVEARENYGPVKGNIRRVPRTTCYGICEQHYKRCMNEFKYVDAGSCENRYRNCNSVCEYTDYHRVG